MHINIGIKLCIIFWTMHINVRLPYLSMFSLWVCVCAHIKSENDCQCQMRNEQSLQDIINKRSSFGIVQLYYGWSMKNDRIYSKKFNATPAKCGHFCPAEIHRYHSAFEEFQRTMHKSNCSHSCSYAHFSIFQLAHKHVHHHKISLLCWFVSLVINRLFIDLKMKWKEKQTN